MSAHPELVKDASSAQSAFTVGIVKALWSIIEVADV
jgi:hypothetical protein